jgi:hypothetical protein
MLYFPQLMSGAVAQWPVVRRIRKRTILNEQIGGGRIALSDAGAASVDWELELNDLSELEMDSIRSLFKTVEGRYGEFTFLDPTDNLLACSGDLGADVWEKDPFVMLTPGVSDPMLGLDASRVSNGGPTGQKVTQQLNAAAWYQYCVSVYVRANEASLVTLFGRAGVVQQRVEHQAGPKWKRINVPITLPAADEHVGFGLEIAAGAEVDVYGLQVEAQPAASGYKRTGGEGGIYPRARFDQDSLCETATGPGRYSCRVRITAVQ